MTEPPTKVSGEPTKIRELQDVILDLQAERDALREEVTNLRSRERRTSSKGAGRSKELRVERDALREVLRDVISSYDDIDLRLSYVNAQINRMTLERAEHLLEHPE